MINTHHKKKTPISKASSRSFDTLTHFRKFYPLLDYPRHVPDPKRRRRQVERFIIYECMYNGLAASLSPRFDRVLKRQQKYIYIYIYMHGVRTKLTLRENYFSLPLETSRAHFTSTHNCRDDVQTQHTVQILLYRSGNVGTVLNLTNRWLVTMQGLMLMKLMLTSTMIINATCFSAPRLIVSKVTHTRCPARPLAAYSFNNRPCKIINRG